jgi:hypothetical protein
MSKIVKLKQSDIEKIVNNILKESNGEFDDFDTQIQPEELPDEMGTIEDLVRKHGLDPNDLDFNGDRKIPEILVGKNFDTGEIVVVNTKTGEKLTPPNQ